MTTLSAGAADALWWHRATPCEGSRDEGRCPEHSEGKSPWGLTASWPSAKKGECAGILFKRNLSTNRHPGDDFDGH